MKTICSLKSPACKTCPVHEETPKQSDGTLVALAGNPNTGKSTVFNALTGLRQHTGNWPGKTISRAEGLFKVGDQTFRLVDLPGTYSLLSASPDEEVARDFLLFGQPDVTVVVLDATALERNLNLALQIRQLTDRIVVCLNLMDEARAHGLEIDVEGLQEDLGVPVIPCAARSGEGIEQLRKTVGEVAEQAKASSAPPPLLEEKDRPQAMIQLMKMLEEEVPGLPSLEWVALRLLTGDEMIRTALREGRLGAPEEDHASTGGTELKSGMLDSATRERILTKVEELEWRMPPNAHEVLTEHIYARSSGIFEKRVTSTGKNNRARWQKSVDRWLTHPLTGFPLMFLIFAGVLWLTIEGANVPSGMIASVLLDQGHPWLRELVAGWGTPEWIVGITIDGMYLACAWVVSVMLPPMAIFFPLFTLLEDLGYLPRIAFNLDRLFQIVGGHGKQALTMSMGLGCNAAGVIACRIIDSPRERLIAILTNNFSLCNGRWPTQILLSGLFIGVLAPTGWSGVISTLAVAGVALLGFALTFISSWLLSRTVLKGEASTFSLELPPFRPPQIWQTLHRSLIDRTLFVLWRAVVFALPAGAVIWLVANVSVGGQSLALWASQALDPLGSVMGMSGLILLAYVVAFPANEIVIPTILMLSISMFGHLEGMGAGSGVMFEPDSSTIREILVASGWTGLTACSVMVFSLCHPPCSTTLYTIYKETGSKRWTFFATVLPLFPGVLLCVLLTLLWPS